MKRFFSFWSTSSEIGIGGQLRVGQILDVSPRIGKKKYPQITQKNALWVVGF
jgi:hypothetical protein